MKYIALSNTDGSHSILRLEVLQMENLYLRQSIHTANLNKSEELVQIPPQHLSTYLSDPKSASIETPSFRPHFIRFSKTVSFKVNLDSQCSHLDGRGTFTK